MSNRIQIILNNTTFFNEFLKASYRKPDVTEGREMVCGFISNCHPKKKNSERQ